MINLLSAQAEIDAAPDCAAVIQVLCQVDQREQSLLLLATELAPEAAHEIVPEAAQMPSSWRTPCATILGFPFAKGRCNSNATGAGRSCALRAGATVWRAD
jgi:hypothetical protein